jgi:hypothetical protein
MRLLHSMMSDSPDPTYETLDRKRTEVTRVLGFDVTFDTHFCVEHGWSLVSSPWPCGDYPMSVDEAVNRLTDMGFDADDLGDGYQLSVMLDDDDQAVSGHVYWGRAVGVLAVVGGVHVYRYFDDLVACRACRPSDRRCVGMV